MVKGLGGKVIASYHDFYKTPCLKDCEEILERLSAYPVDIVKMALMPKNKEDVLNLMLSGRRWKDRHPETELISISMGEVGKLSRILQELSASSHGFVEVIGESAPGQWKIEEYMELRKRLSGKKGICLIGFMGSGKSTLAPYLSELLGREHFDMDKLLEERFAMSIDEYFQKYGEERFRKEEAKLLKELSGKESLLSPGGGVVLREENLSCLKENFYTIYIKVSPDTVLNRLSKGKNLRPLLEGKMNSKDIGEMMEKRRAYYEKAADYILEGDGKSISECIEELKIVLMENGFLRIS